jgi:hypothetical protein
MKRFKKSKFDPYTAEILEMLESGATSQEIADDLEQYFDDVVNPNSICCFIRSRELASKVTQGGTNKNYQAPTCRDCINQFSVADMYGKQSYRLCTKSNRLVNKSCKTSPMWCKKRLNPSKSEG